MLMISMDLEMNQPSGSIIQIGAAVGNIYSGKVVATFSRIIKINETIAPFITELTGITQEMVDKGTSLEGAYKEFIQFKEKWKARKQLICWGQGDTYVLKQQLGKEVDWAFGLRFYDAKTIYQFMKLSKMEATKAGLAKAMEDLGLQFDGKQHDAEPDAVNTFMIFHHMIKRFKGE